VPDMGEGASAAQPVTKRRRNIKKMVLVIMWGVLP